MDDSTLEELAVSILDVDLMTFDIPNLSEDVSQLLKSAEVRDVMNTLSTEHGTPEWFK